MTDTVLSRRAVLAGIAGTLTFPVWARVSARAAGEGQLGTLPPPDRMLLLVNLSGGNDGLNTVVPYLDPAYGRLRKDLALRPDEMRGLSDGLALHHALAGVHSWWGRGRLAIIQNVGYERPNFSHFVSTDIWERGHPDASVDTGWVGRYLDRTEDAAPAAIRAVSVGSPEIPRVLRAARSLPVPVRALSELRLGDRDAGDAGSRHDALRRMAATGATEGGMRARYAASQSRMLDAAAAIGARATAQPKTPAQLMALLFGAGLGVQVGHMRIGGFDTHSTQRAVHADLLTRLDTALSEFFVKAGEYGLADRVTVLVYSEFGRRVGINGAAGTDHGTAQPLLVLGSQVRGGIYGSKPNLDRLADGNLVHEIDMRSVYSTVVERVLGADAPSILGDRLPSIPFI